MHGGLSPDAPLASTCDATTVSQGPHRTFATERTDWARFMTDDEYYPFLVKRDVRPALWRWRDLVFPDGAIIAALHYRHAAAKL